MKEHPSFFSLPQRGCAIFSIVSAHLLPRLICHPSLPHPVFWKATPTRDLTTGVQLSSAGKRLTQEIGRQEERWGGPIFHALLLPPGSGTGCLVVTSPLGSVPLQEPHNHPMLGSSASLDYSFNPTHL